MTYPKAYKGVKKVFLGEVLQVIAALLVVTLTVLTAIIAAGKLPESAAVGTLGLTVAAGVLSILGFIFLMIGLYQGGADESSFRTAFWTVIVIIILTVLQTVFATVSGIPSIVKSLVDVLIGICSVFVTLFILNGIISLADKLHNERMYHFGKLLAWTVVLLFFVSTLLNFIPIFFNNAEWAVNVTNTIAIVAAVVELVTYVLIFIYIGKAVKMLKK